MKNKKQKDNSLFSYYGFTKKEVREYPVISRILKQLTPKRIKAENEAVLKTKLPLEIQKWVREYEKIGERDIFLWKWMYKAVQLITSPTISKKYQKSLLGVKTLIIMFVTLLDDIADKTRKKILLDELLKTPLEQADIKFNRLNQNEKKYLNTARTLWNYIKKTIKKYPRYKEFKNVFEYDITQVINEMRYAYLVNESPHLINHIEYRIYLAYNMQSFVSYTVDLMCSPSFNIRNLRLLREIIWWIQKMAKLGNWISTWERELKEKDFTSGVFAYAVDTGALTADELMQGDTSKIIQKIKSVKAEETLLKEWEQCYWEVEKLSKKIRMIDIKEILAGSEKFLFLHLISRRYI